MVFAWILSYGLPSGTSAGDRRRFERALYGYTDSSNHGGYAYERDGFLSEKPHLIIRPGVLVVPLDLGARTERFLREHDASVWRRRVELGLREAKQLHPIPG